MGETPSENELFDPPFPSAEALRPYVGKVVAYDAEGVVRLAAEDWKQMMETIRENLERWTLMYLPPYRVTAWVQVAAGPAV
jgi:hypothetical protein